MCSYLLKTVGSVLNELEWKAKVQVIQISITSISKFIFQNEIILLDR